MHSLDLDINDAMKVANILTTHNQYLEFNPSMFEGGRTTVTFNKKNTNLVKETLLNVVI
jgi:hypothetical protein